jgi:hypothetical protein
MDFLLGGVAKFLRAMGKVLGGWSFPGDLANAMSQITPLLKKANMFIPISDAMLVFAAWITLQLVLMAYYWITRTINLIRGAG